MGATVINGESREIEDGQRNLLSFIRFDLGLTGTKYACGEGECIAGADPRGFGREYLSLWDVSPNRESRGEGRNESYG